MRVLKVTVAVWTILSIFNKGADARYRFEVGVLSFNNPSGTDANGLPCDFFDSSCEYVFRFCFSALGGTNCVFGVYITQPHHITASSHTFTLGQELIPGSGIPNPLVYTDVAPGNGNPWPGTFNYRIYIEEYDGGGIDANDPVDEISFNPTLLPSSGTQSVTATGNRNKVTMSFQLRVQCEPNFYGNDCFTVCIPKDDSQGHYSCGENGNRVCLDGFTDPSTNCVTSVTCTPPCVNGRCTRTNTCTCDPGWTGSVCDVCPLPSDCPADRAVCVTPGVCTCIEGYSGTVCQNDEDVCGHTSPCLNGGSCTNTGPNSHTCNCMFGYSGLNCETPVNECESSPSPCLNGGVCTSTGPGLFNCSCIRGWTGLTCEEDIDECTPTSPCVRGNCTNCVPTGPVVIDPGNPDITFCPLGYTCTCPPGFYGDHCELDVDECSPSRCVNGGVCHDVVGGPGYSCYCPAGFTGLNCENDVDECASVPSPCMNGGTCTNHVGYYNCSCPSGFLGDNCEIDIDECLTANCSLNNTQQCVNGPGTFTCVCKPGYAGILCDTEINLCESMEPCRNNGSCTTLFNDFECQCAPGFTGDECEVDIDFCINPEICLNGGTCVDGRTTYTCTCSVFFTGPQCETPVNPCALTVFPCGPGQGCIIEENINGYICEECSLIQEDPTLHAIGCQAIINPGGLRGNSTSPVNSALIGGVIGGLVGAILLLILVICFIVCCVKFCACCLAVKQKETESEYEDFPQNATQQNPLYMGANTLLSSQSGTLRSAYGTLPKSTGSPAPQTGDPNYEKLPVSSSSMDSTANLVSLQNPMYDISQTKIERGSRYHPPPPLPTRNLSNSLLTNKVSFLPLPGSDPSSPHYEPIPAHQNGSAVGIAASGKYDQLANESTPALESSFMKTGQYDSLSPATPLSPTNQSTEGHRAVENPYILSPKRESASELTMSPSERGDMYVMLPPVTAFESLKDKAKSAKKTSKADPEPEHEVPTSRENPYEYS